MNLLNNLREKIIRILHWDLEHFNVVQLSKDSYIHPSVELKKSVIKGVVEIEEGCKIIGGVTISSKSNLKIGRYTSIIGPNTDVYCAINSVKIGSFCSIARNVIFQEYNHRINRLSTYFIYQNIFGQDLKNDIVSNGDIEIGNDVWIGAHCVILGGARIGNGAVIAANSVVVGEIPAFAIAAGSPAKVIKYRFNPEKIQEIEEMQWWNWSLNKIINNKKLFFNKP
jgi:acetyltransferase-like isoleucine patch superfamily enzyme